MSKSVEHSGYTIQSAPYQRPDSMNWQILVLISRQSTGDTNHWQFSTKGVYATEEEADLHGITFGQRIIDGKVPGLTVG